MAFRNPKLHGKVTVFDGGDLEVAQPKLKAIVLCLPEASRFSDELLSRHLDLPETLPAARPATPDSLSPLILSRQIRLVDVPPAFHLETPGISFRNYPSSRLKGLARALEYHFDDGVALRADQILYHTHWSRVPRHLLPLAVHARGPANDLEDYFLTSDNIGSSFRPNWMAEPQHVIINILFSTLRSIKAATLEDDDGRSPDSLWLTFDDRIDSERAALKLQAVELLPRNWGPWRINTDLPTPASGIHHGRARLEIDITGLANLSGLAKNFLVDIEKKRLLFHTFEQQLDQIAMLSGSSPLPPHRDHEPPALETGISLHLSGHAHIQTAIHELKEFFANLANQTESQLSLLTFASTTSSSGLGGGLSRGDQASGQSAPSSPDAPAFIRNAMLEKQRSPLSIHPGSHLISREKITPCLAISKDGSFRLRTKISTPFGEFEAHGFPTICSYLIFNLQMGLGATTGYSNTDIAQKRRGAKRDRDLKVLRNLGFALLIFYDAANFAFGLPLTDGTEVSSEKELCESLFRRLGALVVQSEGWPSPIGSLTELCSQNVITLIKGFVSQIVADLSPTPAKGRDVCLYLPQGELVIEGFTQAVGRLLHAMVADLALATGGSCFSRARTKYFEHFMNGRSSPELEDLVVREEIAPDLAARFVYQPGIGERYLLPDTSRFPNGQNLLALSAHGFEVTIDGKVVEEFDAQDFRPEFQLHEGREESSTADQTALPLTAPKIDWFELHPKFFFKGVEISIDQASQLSRDGMIEFQGKLYRIKTKDMPSIKRLSHFWSRLGSQAGGILRSKRRKTEDTYYQLPRSQTLELLALRASGVSVRGGPAWDEITRFYDALDKDRAPLILPQTFHATLQPYQTIGVQWLRDLKALGLGGILADDMGLGKTVTSLAFLESLRSEERMGPTLILVPTSLTYNWLSEAEKFTPQIPVHIFSGKNPESMLDFVRAHSNCAVICTYGLQQEHSEIFQQLTWQNIIFDEAQNLKNITTKRTTAARKLLGAFKVCLTGTPLENHYGEFYSLFDLIVPGSLGELPEFREKFVNPVRVLREDIDFLKLKTRPLLLRRTKAQVLAQLPPKVETTIKLPFEDQQKKIYRDIATSYNEQLRSQIAALGESKMQLQMLTALLRLRQACSDPAAIPGVRYTGEPPKITTLIEAISELIESGASALVFTQFLATYDRIRSALSQANIAFYDISGSDSRLNREKKLRSFQEHKGGSVMLMTLKTGGVGLNLTKASYVFHIEPWWNPAVENQATDRAHRIGQIETVQVYRYLIRDSVEEKIEILKDVKSKRFDALFTVSESENEMVGSGGNALSQKDFEYLLS